MTQLLVSAVKPSGGLYVLDLDAGRFLKVAHDDTTGIEILPSGKIARILRSEDVVELINPLTWASAGIHPLPRRDADYHDLHLQNGVLTVVATMHTAIDFLDLDFKRRATVQFATGKDPWHLNSALLRPDGSMIFTCFGIYQEDEGWRADLADPKGLVVFRNAEGKITVLQSEMGCPHSLRWDPTPGGHIAFCESKYANLHSLREPDDQVAGRLSRKTWGIGSGFLRGMCHVSGKWYVGLSTDRKADTNGGMSKILEINDSGEISREWNLPSPEIYDLLALPRELQGSMRAEERSAA